MKPWIKDEKTKNILSNITFAFFIKGGGLILSFFSMPLYMKFFDSKVVLGVWFSILSMLSWVFSFDLGLGNGLRNKLTILLNSRDKEKSTELAKKSISSAYFSVAALSLVIFVIGMLAGSFINWNSFFRIEQSLISSATLNASLLILFAGILIIFNLKLINSILYSLQKSSINNLLAFVSSIFMVVFLFVSKKRDIEYNLIRLSIVNILTILLPLVIATVIVFSTRLKSVKPSFKVIKKSLDFKILKMGGGFFLAQIFFMLLISTNEIIINTFYHSENVVDYQIYYKIFMLAGSVLTLALTPVWSAVTKAIAQKDFIWVKNINDKLFLYTAIFSLGLFLIIPFTQFVIDIWLKENSIQISYIYAFFFATYGASYLLNIAVTTVANGIGKMKLQVVFYGVGCFIKLPLILFMRIFIDSWVVVVATTSIILIIFIIFQKIYISNYLKKIS